MGKLQTTQAHPFAELFPLNEGKPLWDLSDDIKENGQLEPILLYKDLLLDGRRRELACVRAKIEPKYKNFRGNDTEALALVISKNLHRRHLGEGERALIAAKISNLSVGRPEEPTNNGHSTEEINSANLQNLSQGDAGELLSVSTRSVATAKKVLENASAPLVKAVESGEVSISDAAKIVDQPSKVQNAALKAVKKGKASTLREAVQESTQERQPGEDAPEKEFIDAAGIAVPKQAVEAFERAEAIQEWSKKFDALVRELKPLCEGPGSRLIEYETARLHLKNGKMTILQNRATHVCPLCQGEKAKGKKCECCKGDGWTAAHVYKRIMEERK